MKTDRPAADPNSISYNCHDKGKPIISGDENSIWKTYRDSGLYVFPVTMPDKKPTVSWTKLPDKLIFNGCGAIACGSRSGGLEIIDFDVKNTSRDLMSEFFDSGGESLRSIYKKLVVQTTISGGFHFAYKCNTIGGNQKLAIGKDGKAMIETRGEGGYFVAAPTPSYKFIQGSITDVHEITEDEREVLLSSARSLNEYWPEVKAPTSKTFTAKEGLPPWDDFNQRGDVPALLQSHGWTFLKSVGENDHYCRPDKTRATSGTWHKGKRLFYVFTSSTGFEPSKAYNPSAVFAILEAHGDFADAARMLRAMDFGEKTINPNPKDSHSTQNLFRLTKETSMERPKKLFGPLWAQGENAFLFAEDGAGKSILAVQIGCAIATGQSVPGFQNEVGPQPVTLFDTELSDYQFNTRYPSGLPENFKRLTFEENQQKLLIEASVDFVVDQIEQAAGLYNSKIIILDNLSALCSMVDLVKTSDSIHLMGLLNELKKRGLSVLIIDHCRKPMKEGDFKPISKHDLQGSKMKTNLVDSVFAIGKSAQGESIRYIKALKIRSFEMSYSKDSVATMCIKTNPLRLDFIGIEPEWQHVKDRTSEMMKMSSEGKSQAEIARSFGVSQQAISKILNND